MSITLVSTDPDKYNRIIARIPNINMNGYVNVVATNFISNSHIQVLNKNDYITFKIGESSIKIYMLDSTNIEINSFKIIINALIHEQIPSLFLASSHDSRYYFTSDQDFSIEFISYNLIQILGLYYLKVNDFPLKPTYINESYIYSSKAIGFTNGTPLLYLLSNLGSDSFMNSTNNEIVGSMSIMMRIHNSFIHSQPIISSNGSFMSRVPAAALSNLNLMLVDANRVEVKILSPIYVTVEVEQLIAENPFTQVDMPQYSLFSQDLSMIEYLKNNKQDLNNSNKLQTNVEPSK